MRSFLCDLNRTTSQSPTHRLPVSLAETSAHCAPPRCTTAAPMPDQTHASSAARNPPIGRRSDRSAHELSPGAASLHAIGADGKPADAERIRCVTGKGSSTNVLTSAYATTYRVHKTLRMAIAWMAVYLAGPKLTPCCGRWTSHDRETNSLSAPQ